MRDVRKWEANYTEGTLVKKYKIRRITRPIR